MRKSIKSILTGLFTAGMILAGSSTAFAAVSFEKLPTLVYSELDGLMKKQAAKYVRKDNVVPMLWQGFLEMNISEGRTAKLYVPDNTPQGAMFVAMNVPAGQDPGDFIVNSGWKAKADQEGICLFVLEPAKGSGWGTVEEEADYVKAAIGAARAGKWLQPGPSIYLVEYGEIGSLIQKYAMEKPDRGCRRCLL
ncbi:hypothetical protein ACTQ56_12285 [[Clostridium] aminophilum]|uniref:hypothetical protein n=1 Tax=[Clostridium] aminophilum TaxID=1526 RepID=UPI003F961966